MSKFLKKPKPDKGKKISTIERDAPDPFQLPPKFCLRRMRNGYSIRDCEKYEKAAFADKLYELSQLTWAKLMLASKNGQGYEIINRTSIKGDKVPENISEDVNIIAFRCIGKAPMVGYRSDDGVFNIIWIDRAFTLYDHGR